MTEHNPFEILEIVDMDHWPEGYDPVDAALTNFQPDDLPALARLLRSAEPFVSRRGLYLFGELGRKAYPLVDDALALVDHPDVMARKGLLDGLLCYTGKLSAQQVSRVLAIRDILDYSGPPTALVRGYVIIMIGFLKTDLVREAIGQIPDDELRLQHLKAFEGAQSKIEDIQQAFDKARGLSGVEYLYSMAGLIRAARQGSVETVPEYEGDNFICGTVVRAIKRAIDRHLRRKDPEAWLQKMKDRRRAAKT